jgi:two-component system chemotaxis response regulator CheB
MAAIEDRARDVVVVGASAGGIKPLTRLVSLLPGDLPASLFVAIHLSRSSYLHEILARHSRLVVRVPEDGAPVEPGSIYVAPSGHQLELSGESVHLVPAARRDGPPTAINALFRSAAESYGDRVIAVVLSGALDDGTAGMQAVSDAGGLRLVQDPAEADQPSMPMNAIRGDSPQAVGPVDLLAALIGRAARGLALDDPRFTLDGPLHLSNGHEIRETEEMLGPSLPLTCPECGGALWQKKEGTIVCHVGHEFSVEQFESLHDLSVDAALWTAVRTLEERAEIARRLGDMSVARGQSSTAERFAARVREARAQADEIRKLVRSLAEKGAAAR